MYLAYLHVHKCIGSCCSLRNKQPKTVKFIFILLVAFGTCWECHCHCAARWPEQWVSLFVLDSGGNSFVTSTESVSAPPRPCVWLPFHQRLPGGLSQHMEDQNGKLLFQLGFCHDSCEKIGLFTICLLARFTALIHLSASVTKHFPV